MRLFRFLAAAVPMLAASFAFGEIAGSKHDFTAASWADQNICKPCHTPHNAIETGVTGRLWAHTLSTATYTYHGSRTSPVDGSTTTDGADTTITQDDMDGASRLCLSCHDGSVALDSFMGKNGASDGMAIGTAGHGEATANLGVDLSNDHPVGFRAVYQENKGSGGHYYYKPLAPLKSAPYSLKFATSPTAVPAGSLDQDGNAIAYTNWPSVSCVTCHDVHNGKDLGDGLLRYSNEGSGLCLACHVK